MSLIGSDELNQFYSKKFYFSYSSINKLLFSPSAFYNHYVLKQKEDSTDAHLVAGRVLHCLLLEENKFNDQFIVLPSKVPKDNNKLILDEIYIHHCLTGNHSLTLSDYNQEILDILLRINLHQSLKTDQQRLEKIITEDNKNYFEFLKNCQGKTIVDQQTLDGCRVSVEILKSNTTVRALMQLDKDEDDPVDIHNELQLQMDIPNLPFGYKGVLDNVVIDYAAKIIFVNDLKTTGKNLADFPEAVKFYKYWIQAVVYMKLAHNQFIKDLFDADEWNIIVTFIVIDKYNQVYPFQVSKESLNMWQNDFVDIENVLTYHYVEKDYTLPYDLALGNIKL